jgi:NADPH:quinone reductase-like Zn-dependent oxidoreductase
VRTRAVVMDGLGGVDVLQPRETELRAMRPDDVLLAVLATAVNHLDLELRSGASRMPLTFPHVLGREVVGEIVAVGDDVVDHRIGDRVLVLPNSPCGRCRLCLSGHGNVCRSAFLPGITGWGGYAEHMVVEAKALLPAPDVDPTVVAATPISFGTAWRMLYTIAGLQPGETVLVAGAAGGLGHAVTQIAALGGARVIGLVSGPAKADFVRANGAAEVLDSTDPRWPDQARELTGGDGVDVVVEHIGGEVFERALTTLTLGGRLVVGGGHGGEHPSLDVIDVFRNEFRLLGSRSQRPDEIAQVLRLLASGRIAPAVDEVLPIAEAARAHEMIAARGVRGKLVLTP